jgi:2-oxoglutarate ferredoxin oxidoreductase subunit alpha
LDTAENYRFFSHYENKNSDTMLIAYGIAARVIWPLRKSYGIFRPISIFPMLDKELKSAADGYKKIVVVEMNDGQYAREVERVLKREVFSIPVLGGSIKLNEIQKILEKNEL